MHARAPVWISLAAVLSTVASRVCAQPAPTCESLRQQAHAAQEAGDRGHALALAQRVAAVRPTGTLHGFMAVQHYELQQRPEALREARACLRDLPTQSDAANREWYQSQCQTIAGELEREGVTPAPEPPPPAGAASCVIANAPAAEAQPPPPPAPRPVETPAPRRTPARSAGAGPWLLMGAGALTAGAGALFILPRNAADNRAQELCQSPETGVCALGASMDARREGDTFHGLFLGLAIAGGAATLAGAIWYGVERARVSSHAGSSAPSRLRLTFTPTPGGVLAGLGGAL